MMLQKTIPGIREVQNLSLLVLESLGQYCYGLLSFLRILPLLVDYPSGKGTIDTAIRDLCSHIPEIQMYTNRNSCQSLEKGNINGLFCLYITDKLECVTDI